MKKGVKRSRQVLVISSIVIAVALLIVASLAYPPGQREITKTTTETVLKTETQSTTITEMPTEGLKTVISYSTEYIQTTIPTIDIETTSAATTVTVTTRELITGIGEPWEDAALAVFLELPREVEEPACIQHTIEFNFGTNATPSGIESFTDEYGNNYVIFFWNEEPKNKFVISFEAVVFRQENPYILPETSPHPYPCEHLTPEEIKQYLKPMPSELEPFYYNPDITDLAKELSRGLSDEVMVVNNTMNWIAENIKYDYGDRIRKQHPGLWTPIETLKYKAGREEAITDLTLVLLTIQGIPARRVSGHVYCWVQVYYPKIRSWVNYDPAAWAATQDPQILLKLHIERAIVSKWEIATGRAFQQTIGLEEDKCSAKEMGRNRVYINRTITFVPKS